MYRYIYIYTYIYDIYIYTYIFIHVCIYTYLYLVLDVGPLRHHADGQEEDDEGLYNDDNTISINIYNRGNNDDTIRIIRY